MKREILIEALVAMLQKRAARKRAGVTPESPERSPGGDAATPNGGRSPFTLNVPAELAAYAQSLVDQVEERIDTVEQALTAFRARHRTELRQVDEELRILRDRIETLEQSAGITLKAEEPQAPPPQAPPASQAQAEAAFRLLLDLYAQAPEGDRMAGVRKLSAADRMAALNFMVDHTEAARAVVMHMLPEGQTLATLYGSTQIPDPTFDDVLMSFAQTLAILGTRVVM